MTGTADWLLAMATDNDAAIVVWPRAAGNCELEGALYVVAPLDNSTKTGLVAETAVEPIPSMLAVLKVLLVGAP